MERNTRFDDSQFWADVKEIASQVDQWPQWKKEGWAALDKRERPNLDLKKRDQDSSSQYNINRTKS